MVGTCDEKFFEYTTQFTVSSDENGVKILFNREIDEFQTSDAAFRLAEKFLCSIPKWLTTGPTSFKVRTTTGLGGIFSASHHPRFVPSCFSSTVRELTVRNYSKSQLTTLVEWVARYFAETIGRSSNSNQTALSFLTLINDRGCCQSRRRWRELEMK